MRVRSAVGLGVEAIPMRCMCPVLNLHGLLSTCSSARRFAGAFTLRQRMLNFVQNIQYYMMFEVMEPTWHILEKNLKSVSFCSINDSI